MDNLGKIFHVNLLGYAHWFMSIRISQMKDHSISVDQDRYATSIITKYLNTAIFKASTKFYKLRYHLICYSQKDTSISDEQVEKFTTEFIIHYRACIGSLIYILSTRVDFSITVHNLAMFSANPGKLHFEGLVHLLRYIRYNNNLGLKYYSDINDAPVSDLLRQAIEYLACHVISCD